MSDLLTPDLTSLKLLIGCAGAAIIVTSLYPIASCRVCLPDYNAMYACARGSLSCSNVGIWGVYSILRNLND